FHNHVLFAYDDSASSANNKSFQTVHYGGASINIRPEDTKITPVTVAVSVQKPLQLGDTRPATGPRSIRNDTGFDERIARHAHRTGIPPQYLKGQMDQESELGIGIMDPLDWRYELYKKDKLFLQATTCGMDPNGHDHLPFNCQLWPLYRMLDTPPPPTPGQPPPQPPPVTELCPSVALASNPVSHCGFQGLDDLAPRSRQDKEYP